MTQTWMLGILVLFLMGSLSCSRSDSGVAWFNAVWDVPVPKSLNIVRKVGNRGHGFAVFAKLPQADFEAFKRATSDYTTWNRLADGMSFEVGGNELQSPSDISGVYSVGGKTNGLVKVVVWDEETETIVTMSCSGIM